MLEALSEDPPRLVGRPVFRQRWSDLTMLHWPVDPAVVAPLLPAGTTPDVLPGPAGDVTYVGLVPFVMSGVRVLGTPPLPWLSAFPETNIRLYAVDADGRRGVVFRSLEAARLLPVLVARVAYGLPYFWAGMSVRHGVDGARDIVSYQTRRRWPGPRGAGGLVRIAIGPPMDTDPLTLFLTARWGLYSRFAGGRTAWAPVWHEPWRLHSAELLDLRDDLADVGLAAGPRRHAPPVGPGVGSALTAAGPPHLLWSPGVDVRIGRPTLLPMTGKGGSPRA